MGLPRSAAERQEGHPPPRTGRPLSSWPAPGPGPPRGSGTSGPCTLPRAQTAMTERGARRPHAHRPPGPRPQCPAPASRCPLRLRCCGWRCSCRAAPPHRAPRSSRARPPTSPGTQRLTRGSCRGCRPGGGTGGGRVASSCPRGPQRPRCRRGAGPAPARRRRTTPGSAASLGGEREGAAARACRSRGGQQGPRGPPAARALSCHHGPGGCTVWGTPGPWVSTATAQPPRRDLPPAASEGFTWALRSFSV